MTSKLIQIRINLCKEGLLNVSKVETICIHSVQAQEVVALLMEVKNQLEDSPQAQTLKPVMTKCYNNTLIKIEATAKEELGQQWPLNQNRRNASTKIKTMTATIKARGFKVSKTTILKALKTDLT